MWGLDPERTKSQFRGCLVAGAVGDALGAPVEFWSLSKIRQRLGADGVSDFVGGRTEVSDDTQMTFFTAEGLIRMWVRANAKGIGPALAVVRFAYLRWLHTQGDPWYTESMEAGWSGWEEPSGWLVNEARLHVQRAPGNTCLSSLRSSKELFASNESKGCGAVMRAAPAGLINDIGPEFASYAFEIGYQTAAITHGHSTAKLCAGAMAGMIARLIAGDRLFDAVHWARDRLKQEPDAGETLRALEAAVSLAAEGLPTPDEVETLGRGWVSEEALAIAVCCALAAPDIRSGLLAAVNHSGDSDSTGSMCGHLLGGAYGIEAVPAEWASAVEMGDLAVKLADDLWTQRFDTPDVGYGEPTDEWRAKYPGH